jgi:hypothetical protein
VARGRFYRRRGVSGSLSALIAQLIREHRAAQDRAIFDAYRNGGQFEGKPVNDSRLLEYIQSRRDGFTKDDPLWDEWNNTFIQQKFTIGEQKIGLRYKQGKASTSDVAAFYRQQLKSIPKDSQFYREVAGRAAEWAKAARAAGRGSSQRAAYDKAQDAGNRAQDAEAAWFMTDQAIRAALAREGYAPDPNQSVVQSVGADVVGRLFNEGKVIAPGGGTLSIDSWHQVSLDYSKALQRQAKAYKAAGQNYTTILDGRARFERLEITPITTIPYATRAERFYSTLNDQLEAANGDPDLIAKAYRTASQGIDILLKDAQENGADEDVVSLLTNDAKALRGESPSGPGMLDNILEANFNSGQEPMRFLETEEEGVSHSAWIAQDVKVTSDGQKLVSGGRGFLVQNPETGVLEVADSSQTPPSSLGQEYQPTIIMQNGVPRQVYLTGTPVYANAQYDNDGNIVPLSDPRRFPTGAVAPEVLVGYQFSYTLGGAEIEAWGVRDAATGVLSFTAKNPFLGDTRKANVGGKNAIVVMPPDLDGEPILLTDITSTDALRGATSTLVIDPEGAKFIKAQPERGYDLVRRGALDPEAYIQTIQPGAQPGTTAEDALQTALQEKRDAAATLYQHGQRERGEVTQSPAQQIQQNILSSIVGYDRLGLGGLKITGAGPFQPQEMPDWASLLAAQRAAEYGAPPRVASAPPEIRLDATGTTAPSLKTGTTSPTAPTAYGSGPGGTPKLEPYEGTLKKKISNITGTPYGSGPGGTPSP